MLRLKTKKKKCKTESDRNFMGSYEQSATIQDSKIQKLHQIKSGYGNV